MVPSTSLTTPFSGSYWPHGCLSFADTFVGTNQGLCFSHVSGASTSGRQSCDFWLPCISPVSDWEEVPDPVLFPQPPCSCFSLPVLSCLSRSLRRRPLFFGSLNGASSLLLPRTIRAVSSLLLAASSQHSLAPQHLSISHLTTSLPHHLFSSPGLTRREPASDLAPPALPLLGLAARGALMVPLAAATCKRTVHQLLPAARLVSLVIPAQTISILPYYTYSISSH